MYYLLMFTLGVALDIVCLTLWPSAAIVDDIEVQLFQERLADVEWLLGQGTLTEDDIVGDLAEVIYYERGSRVLWWAVLRELGVSLALFLSYMEVLCSLQLSEVVVGDSSN